MGWISAMKGNVIWPFLLKSLPFVWFMVCAVLSVLSRSRVWFGVACVLSVITGCVDVILFRDYELEGEESIKRTVATVVFHGFFILIGIVAAARICGGFRTHCITTQSSLGADCTQLRKIYKSGNVIIESSYKNETIILRR